MAQHVSTSDAGCIVPECGDDAVAHGFCAKHGAASKYKRAGWRSAVARKKAVMPSSSERCAWQTRSDVNAVAPRLWVGSRPPVDVDLPHVDVLVLCAKEFQPAKLVFHGEVLRCPMDDATLTRDEINRALITSKAVAAALTAKRRVLSTCAMGLNRSAFVAALALGRITYASADELVEQLRARRDPRCLTNPHMVELLGKFVGDGRRSRR